MADRNNASEPTTTKAVPAPWDEPALVLRSEVEVAVRSALRHDFHEPSRTHIVWCPGIGRGAAKGFGDAADEALRVFRQRVAELLDAAAPSDFQRWRSNLLRDEAERLREAQVRSLAASERMGEYSLGLDPAHLRHLSGDAGDGPANERIVEALKGGLAALREQVQRRTLADLRGAVAEHERFLRDGRRERGDEPRYRTVRMDAETHAKLRLQAHELGVKLQELCRYVIGLHLRRAGPRAAAVIDGPRAAPAPNADPFADLDSAAFARVAVAARMRRAVLAAIRDGRVADLPLQVAGRIGTAMPVPVPANDIVAHAAGGTRMPLAVAARSDAQPAADARRVSLEEAARAAGMSGEDIARMLAE